MKNKTNSYLTARALMLASVLLLATSMPARQTDRLPFDQSLRDSLKQQIFIAEQDTMLVYLLTTLADSYWVSKYDSAIFYARNALLIARKIEHRSGELRALLTLSLVSSELGDVVKGYEYSSMAINLSTELDDHQLLAQSYGAAGKVLIKAEDYRPAIDATLKALTIPELTEKQKFRYYIQLADAYAGLGKNDSANYFANRAETIIPDKEVYLANSFRVIGNKYRRQEELSKARDFYEKALIAGKKYEDYTALLKSYKDISLLYKSYPDSVMHYSTAMLETAEKSRNITLIIEASSYLSALYEQVDAKRSLELARKSSEAKDSLKHFIQDQSMRSFSDFEQKLRKLEIEQARNEVNDQLKQNTFAAGIIILSIIAFALYRNNRIKQRGKKRVEKAYLELKKTQDQLIQSEKMASLGELTAGIAHEIQNPLNFVNNFADLNIELIEEQLEEIREKNFEQVTEIAEDIKSNNRKIVHHGKRAEEIVKSMLLHSRGNEGTKEAVNINKLAEEYLRLSYHGLRAKESSLNATFKTDLDSKLPEVQLVPQDIGRVLLNLFNNAFYAVNERAKAMTDNYEPTVEILTREISNQVEITIRDNGKGIPPEFMDKIFQPFFTTKAAGSGTGLGLSLSYDIITKRSNGSIAVASEVGKGTEFRITLPLS